MASVPLQQPVAPVTSASLTSDLNPLVNSTQAPSIIPCGVAGQDLEFSSTHYHHRSTTAPELLISTSSSPATPKGGKVVRLRSRTVHTTLPVDEGAGADDDFIDDEEEEAGGGESSSTLTTAGSKRKASSSTSTAAGSGSPRSQKKMFVCIGYGECEMSFSRAEHLARHVRKHTGERPFQCHCGREFSRLDNLRQHAQTVHADSVEMNTEMMVRLAAVHNALAASSSAKVKAKAKIAAKTTPKQKSRQIKGEKRSYSNSEEDQQKTPVPHPLEPPSAHYFQQAAPDSPSVLMPSPFMPSHSPNMQDYVPRQHYQMPDHQEMMPVYDQMMHPEAMHPDDYASYALYNKPTLPSISALIPRKGAQVSPQQMAQFGFMPPDMSNPANMYQDHIPAHSSGYGWTEQPQPAVSPKSATLNGEMTQGDAHHLHMQQQQQQVNQYMALHGGPVYHSSAPPPNDLDPHLHYLPRSFSTSSASSGASYGSEPSLVMSNSSNYSHTSYPSTPSPKHLRMPIGPYPGHPYMQQQPAPMHMEGPPQGGDMMYGGHNPYSNLYQLPLQPNSHDQLPQDLTIPVNNSNTIGGGEAATNSFHDQPPTFARRQSLKDLLCAANAVHSPQLQSSPMMAYESPAVGAGTFTNNNIASPGGRNSREAAVGDLEPRDMMFKRQHVMA